jgi:peptidoglycan/xylan/chitin deacetylase (PgdA/CDA1 family)
MTRSIPILTYHHVTPEDVPNFRKYVVTPRLFAAQIGWLARHGYTSVDLGSVIGDRANLPRRPVVITFDDGYRECVENAVPILERWGFKAVFFLVAGLMGETSRWLELQLPLIDWPSARRLERAGFVCASHTLSHPRLTSASADACRRELQASRARLEDELGHSVLDFAYPFGAFDARVRAAVAEAGYRSACAGSVRHAWRADDPLVLRRTRLKGDDSLFDFVWRLATGLSVGEWVYTRKLRLRGRLMRLVGSG